MKKKNILFVSFVSIFLLLVMIIGSNNKMIKKTEGMPVYSFAALTPTNNDFVYLSDIDYIANQSFTRWGSILKDVTSTGAKISVKVEGSYYAFDKGMWAHATSTLVYDISGFNYDYFTAYVGLNNTAAASSNGVKFFVYTSVDGTNWDLKTEENPNVQLAGGNATFLKVNIKGAKYLKLYAHDNGANGNDHAVYADAKLTNAIYDDNVVPTVAYYDDLIKREYSNADLSDERLELLVLQRNFVNNVGQFALRRFVSESEDNKVVLEWLFNNLENLRLYTLGGAPDGGYYNSLNVLARLYKNYKSDLDNRELLHNTWYPDLTYGDLYKKMMITLSLTHSTNLGLWMQAGAQENKSDAVVRYAIYRYMHKNGNFIVTKNQDGTPNIDRTEWFEALHVEEMRFIFNNLIDDEEILWLNAYVQGRIDENPGSAGGLLTPHPYIAYVWPNYQNPVYYAEENVAYFNELFAVPDKNNPGQKIGLFDLEFTIPGGTEQAEYKLKVTRGTPDYKLYKLWMNFRNKFGTGSVCGGISKSGSNIRTTHGIPATVIGQPGHAALLYYTKNTQGKGFWGIDNDVSGWTLSEKGERMLIGWGNQSYQRGYSVVYMVLAQEALNDFDNFSKAEELVMLAKAYQGDLSKQEELLREALRVQPINIDAWYLLIQNFNNNSAKTGEDYYNLAKEIADNLMPFPLPMYHLTNLIKPKLTEPKYIYLFALLQDKTLKEASALPNTATDLVLQPGVSRVEANYLLRQVDNTIATFSFDGEDAGKIVLSSRFDGNGVRFDYSLDGKNTWKEVAFTGEEAHKWQLTSEEIEKITAENDIYVHIVGTDYTEDNLFKIDITKPELSNILYANDLENRVIGIDLTYEWRNSESDAWTSYAVASPNNAGDKSLDVRIGATGTRLASDFRTFTFTEDNQSDKRKYVSISHLTVEAYSTQSRDGKRPFYAPNAIDGNINTLWHTDFAINVLLQAEKPFITLKLDSPKYISALEFVQTKYRVDDPDYIKNMRVYVSQDGEEWTEAGRIENCEQNTELKAIEFDKSIYGEYVKLEMDTYSMFASLAMINVFEDVTKLTPTDAPKASIAYDISTETNNNVVVRVVNPSTDIRIINNNGSDTYTFTENGEFTFKFEDKACEEDCLIGSVTAKVSWIDKEAPTAKVNYSTTRPTREEVVATLGDISEDVYVIQPDNKVTEFIHVENKKVKSITYYDNNGDIVKIAYVDDEMQATKIEYYSDGDKIYVTELNKSGAIIKETFYDSEGNEFDPENKDDYRKYILGGRSNPLENTFSSNGKYVFRIKDKAGNIANIEANVENIDVIAPVAVVIYNITTVTDEVVIATLTGASEPIEIINNNGSDTYTFTENGEFTFEFQDEAGNVGYAKAEVTWIKDKENPTPPGPEDPDEPDMPDEPDTPDDPTEPDNPDDPNKPTPPEPDKPEEPGNSNISDPTNSNKPSESKPNNGGHSSSNVNNNQNSNVSNNNQGDNEDIWDYRELADLGVMVGINGLKTELDNIKYVKVVKYPLSPKLQEQVGRESEIFELNFVDKNNKVLDMTNPKLTLTVYLNANKEFEGIYIWKNNVLKELDYEKINENTIKVTTDDLGEYVVKYKSEIVDNQEEEHEDILDTTSSNYIWYVASAFLLILFAIIVIIYKFKNN